MREVRRIAADYQRQGGDWRDVIDAMRPLVSTLWKSWPQQDKTRFVEHAAPYSAVHRHRCPLSTSRLIDQLRAPGQHIGISPVLTPVTISPLVCRLLLSQSTS